MDVSQEKMMGIYLLPGMLERAQSKIQKHHWKNIQLIQKNMRTIDQKCTKNRIPPINTLLSGRSD